MREHLREHPANIAWQQQVTPLQSTPDDYSGDDDGLPFVWSLARQLADAGEVDERETEAGARPDRS
jgi:L-rhamnose mutarotase